ncbi:MAG: aspartate kinase [Bacteroidota bacterium]|nr:aspartate kinase [Bacteroidota bacterium]
MNQIQVYKFGGASVKNAEGFQNVGKIITEFRKDTPLVVVVSATGKTTNQLEEVVQSKFTDVPKSMILLQGVKEKHIKICQELGFQPTDSVFIEINDHFVEAEWVIEESREMPYDYAYDQIVSVGELISSRILFAWLKKIEQKVSWKDARNLIEVDDTWREGRVKWKETIQRIQDQVLPEFNHMDIILTQGFIASTKENNTVTLGREGSDYTGAILSNALDAESMSIWKDVPGILTADPSVFVNVIKLDRLSYTEAIEMTYYGAKVIHPKTIQPLQNKNIPLYVKSFIQPEAEGSLISGDIDLEYPPIVVSESEQALIHFSSLDLSFIAEHHLARLFDSFEKHRIKVNMMRNTAISFSVCVHNDASRIATMIKEVEHEYKVVVDHDLELITVRHYQDAMLPKLLEEKIVILEERIRKTLQMVVRNAPAIMYKK